MLFRVILPYWHPHFNLKTSYSMGSMGRRRGLSIRFDIHNACVGL